MIVCSCTIISDRDIETGLLEILGRPDAPIPTPGIVFRQLRKRMNCCGCAPLAVETIYRKVEELERRGLLSEYVCATARSKLLEFTAWRELLHRREATACPFGACARDGARKVA